MAKVKPISLLYIDGIRGVTQKHKSGERRHRKKDGTFVEPLGFGNAKEYTPFAFPKPSGSTNVPSFLR